MDNGQKTPRGHPDFHSYLKFKVFSYSRHLSGKHSFTLLSQPLRTDIITDGGTYTLATRGLEEPFFQLCCCVSIWFWWEIGFGFTYYIYMYSEYKTVVVLCQFFLIWREIVFGVTYVLSVQYSCAVVSVFWLWREIVFNLRTRSYKKILLGYFIMIRQPMCVFYKT